MSHATSETPMSPWLWRVGLLAILVFSGWCLLTILAVQRMRADVEEHVGWLIEIQSIREATELDDPQWHVLRDRLILLKEAVSAHPDSLGDGSGIDALGVHIDATLTVIPPDWTPMTPVDVDGFQKPLNTLVRSIRGRTGGLSAMLNQYWNSLILLALSALLLSTICGGLAKRLSKQRLALARANRHLAAAKRNAEAANHSKSQFLADMSHEIRTPMNAILGMTHLVLESPLEQEQRAQLRVVRDSSEALLGLINSLLDFSKIDAGRLEIESRAFDLRACVGGVLRALAMGAAEKGLELIGDVATEVPHQILGDEPRLRQTLLNLVGNAVKFTDSGAVCLRIRLVAEASASNPRSEPPNGEFELAFSVQDTGIGIPANKLEEVFIAYKQADASTSRRFGGTGLGLPISQRLVGLMGGCLTCESEPGRGSTFRFTLPTRTVGSNHNPMYKHEKAALNTRQLVIIEPNQMARATITRMANDWGMRVEAVGDPTELSLRAPTFQKDYLLVINGEFGTDSNRYESFERLLAQNPGLAQRTLMMLPVTVPRNRRQRIEELGVCHVTKPALDSDLRVALAEVATARRLKREASDPLPSPRIEKSKLKILVVDDSATNRMLAVGLLGKHTDVSVAHDGRQALEMLDQHDFELVLMDVHMPVMNGLEATRMLRKHEVATGQHLPVIALTAGATSEERARCLEAGMDDFLDKPIRPQLLYTKINTLMRERPKTSTSPNS